jgi:CheY-like chemotaxis protein
MTDPSRYGLLTPGLSLAGPAEFHAQWERDITPADLVAIAEAADRLGYDHLTCSEHVGIPPDVQKRIFEPFFTTKGAGRGTGIGLATVLGIVQQSGGHVWFYSEPGKGTTFKVFLPRLAKVAAQMAAVVAEPGVPVARGGETILMVEDDPQVREVVSRMLRAAGFRPLVFGSAREALASLALPENVGQPPALLLTDLVMPDMGGDELAKAVRERYPDLRILFMSGYAQDLVAGRFDDLAPFHHIGKPFGAKALRDRIRNVLDEPVG